MEKFQILYVIFRYIRSKKVVSINRGRTAKRKKVQLSNSRTPFSQLIPNVRRKLFREFLLQTGPLTSALTQIIKLGPADVRFAVYFDFLYAGRISQEYPLHTDAIAGNAAHCKSRGNPALALPDNGALKFLHAFVGSFFNPQKNANCISNAEIRQVGTFGGGYSLQ
jgi:hypothetical protein